MACKYVSVSAGGGFMRQNEWGFGKRTGVPAHELLPPLRRLAPIVISNHNIDRQTSMCLAPDMEGMQEAVTRLSEAVEEIAQHNEPRTGVLGHEPGQPLQVGNGRTPRQRNSRPPEDIVLAEMRVGNDERGARRPKQRACRMQSQLLPRQLDVEAFKRHG